MTFLIGVLFSTGCDKPRVLPVIDLSGEEFVSTELTNAASGIGELSFETADQEFENFEWTASDYGQPISISYNFQIASDNTFADAQTLLQTTSRSLSVTVKEVNDLATLAFGLEPFVEADLFFRVTSIVPGTPETALTSSAIKRTVTPYVTDFPSAYMIGDALMGWDWATTVEIYGIGNKKYEVVARFTNGDDDGPDGVAGNFRFFELNDGDWGGAAFGWSDFTNVGAEFSDAGSDNNITFTGVTGFYKIAVDLSTGTLEMLEALTSEPSLYMVGAGVPDAGWSWDTPVDMTWIQDGVFETTTNFLNGESFRFFTANGDWNSGLNFPYFVDEEYTIDANFEDALDGDNNFRYIGETGEFSITVNQIEKTIVIGNGPSKWMVGAGLPLAGWSWDSPVELVQVAPGVFETTTEFANDAFRTFDANGDWGSGTNYPGYLNDGYTIDANFEDALDGDNNFSFIGTPGTFKFTLDTNSKTIVLE